MFDPMTLSSPAALPKPFRRVQAPAQKQNGKGKPPGMNANSTALLSHLYFPFLRDFSREEIEDLRHSITLRWIEKKEFVHISSQTTQKVYFVVHGNVEIGYLDESGRELSIDILIQGDIFGGFLSDAPGSAVSGSYARAMGRTLLAEMDPADVERFQKINPLFARKMMQIIHERIRTLEYKLQSLVFCDVKTRICRLLYSLYQKAGDPVKGQIKIALTHQDIANLVASSRETASLHLSELKKNGVIDYERKYIRIESMTALESAIGNPVPPHR